MSFDVCPTRRVVSNPHSRVWQSPTRMHAPDAPYRSPPNRKSEWARRFCECASCMSSSFTYLYAGRDQTLETSGACLCSKNLEWVAIPFIAKIIYFTGNEPSWEFLSVQLFYCDGKNLFLTQRVHANSHFRTEAIASANTASIFRFGLIVGT